MTIYKNINTRFISEIDLIKKINDKKFIFNIIEVINPSKYNIYPSNINHTNKVIWPKTIEYTDSPNFFGNFIKFPEVNIKQEWDLKNNMLIGTIYTYLKGKHILTAILKCKIEKKKKIFLNTQCYWEYKSPIVPNFMINNILNSLEKILNEVLNK